MLLSYRKLTILEAMRTGWYTYTLVFYLWHGSNLLYNSVGVRGRLRRAAHNTDLVCACSAQKRAFRGGTTSRHPPER